jgi:outer membrane protein assembly factor BamB
VRQAGTELTETWAAANINEAVKGLPERHVLATPAVANGLAYITDSSGLVHCVDVVTGKACWTHQARGDFWASPLVADGKIYVATRRGDVLVFAAAREKRVLSTVEFGEPISGTPIAANGVLYLATMSRLYALQRPATASAPAGDGTTIFGWNRSSRSALPVGSWLNRAAVISIHSPASVRIHWLP